MRVTLSKHGGWLAGIQLGAAPRVVDGTALSRSESAELVRLISAAEARPAAPARVPGRGGDVGSYVLTIEEGGRTRELRQSDQTMSPEFAKLVEWIESRRAAP